MAPVEAAAAPSEAPVAACRTAPDAAVSCATTSEGGDEAGPNAAPSATGMRSSASQGSLPGWLSTLMLFSPQASVAMSVAMTQQQEEEVFLDRGDDAAAAGSTTAVGAKPTVLEHSPRRAEHAPRRAGSEPYTGRPRAGSELPCALDLSHSMGGREMPCALDLAMAANALVDVRLHARLQAERLGAMGGVGSRRVGHPGAAAGAMGGVGSRRGHPGLVIQPPPAPPAIAAALDGPSPLSNGGSGSNSPQHRLTPKGLLDRLTSSSQNTPRGAQHSTATSPSSRTSAAARASVAAQLSPPTERFDANPDLVAMRSKRSPVSTERERADGTGTSLAGSPPGAHHGASSVAARPGAAGIDDLLFYLRRNEQLLQQQREQLLERNAELRAELGARGIVAPLHVASYQQLEVGVHASVHTAASQLEAYDAILDVAAMEHALGKGWTLHLSPLARTRGKLIGGEQSPQSPQSPQGRSGEIRGEQSPQRQPSHGTSNLGTTATANFAREGPLKGTGTRSRFCSKEVAGGRETAEEKGGRETAEEEMEAQHHLL